MASFRSCHSRSTGLSSGLQGDKNTRVTFSGIASFLALWNEPLSKIITLWLQGNCRGNRSEKSWKPPLFRAIQALMLSEKPLTGLRLNVAVHIEWG